MIIKSLDLINYRNYQKINVVFNSNINFIFGDNGQGKTNLIEAIYYLSTMKSHRINEDLALIKNNEDYARIIANVVCEGKNKKLNCNITSKGKHLFINNVAIKKVSNFIGELNAVLFCPNDVDLFINNPAKRRQLIDIELSKLSFSYTEALKKYKVLLKDRNKYLKNIKGTVDEDFLSCIDNQLIELQLVIIEQRYKFLNEVFLYCNDFYQQFTNDNESKLSYKYFSFVDFNEDRNIMRQNMQRKYKSSLKKDTQLKTTNVGIHRDDFMYFMNDNEIKYVASQGQKRSIVISLKIGIAKTIYKVTKQYPVILLDDIFSELDKNRRIKLLNLFDKNMQIFITSNDKIDIGIKNITYYEVKKNKILEVK